MATLVGAVARAARLEAGRTLMDIAVRAEVSQSTIHNFEQGNRWVQETDRIIDAYELECSLEPRELWRRALEQA